MRGKQRPHAGKKRRYRITPADAGKTCMCAVCNLTREDHPRGCGENRYVPDRQQRGIGSPPRMRGKHENLFANSHSSRITPADAGKTSGCLIYRGSHKDHPRGCGENPKVTCFLGMAAGSPPRMRGKRLNQPIRRQSRRITPADAGKTCGFRSTLIYHTDHPRGCGENITPLNLTYPCTGSPPRMRGKRRHSRRFAVMTRITPADAGKTVP